MLCSGPDRQIKGVHNRAPLVPLITRSRIRSCAKEGHELRLDESGLTADNGSLPTLQDAGIVDAK